MSEIGTVIAEVPAGWAGEATVTFATKSLDVEGKLTAVGDREKGDGRRIVVEEGGTEYHLTARPTGAGPLEGAWRADAVRTSGGVSLGKLTQIEIVPDDEMEPEIPEALEEFTEEDEVPDEPAYVAIGGSHQAATASRSLADRRSARTARAQDYSRRGSHEAVRAELRKDGTDRRVVEEFRKLITAERRVIVPRGERLDLPTVVRFFAGDETVHDELYVERQTADTGERVIGLALDMSGSMKGSELDAKAAVAALAVAADELDDEMILTAFPQGRRSSALLTGPYESWEWWHLDACWPAGGTPMVAGIRDTARLMEHLNGRERIMFVVTDGMPSKKEECAELVDALRRGGTAVVGFGIGRVSEAGLESIFGRDGYRAVDVKDLPRALLSAYLNQLETNATLRRRV